MGTDLNVGISGGSSKGGRSSTFGSVSSGASFNSSDRGMTSEAANASIDIVNYDVREVISTSERKAANSSNPESAFTNELSRQVVGNDGLRNRYLEQADSARGTTDFEAPVTSFEQSSVLSSGRFADDLAHGPFDGDSTWKERRDR